MMTHEIYCHDPIKGYQLPGVLPERREDPTRITEESITNWGRKFFCKSLDIDGIFILQLKTGEMQSQTFTRKHIPWREDLLLRDCE